MYLLGYDIGSSSVKAALVDADTGKCIAKVQSPNTEMQIDAPKEAWAEQSPEMWWQHVCTASQKLFNEHSDKTNNIKGIGISYQMHGLVLVDEAQIPLRPSIIWCDSRAVSIGEKAFKAIGEERCLKHLLNSPANFTASKLKWVKDNEPHVYERIHKAMLPGDYIAMKMTGEILTTPSGLSEGILWDFQENELADIALEYFGFDKSLFPNVQSTFSTQGSLTNKAAEAMGLSAGIPVSYRAGDQPNNALALNVLQAGEVAATGGTSGVVYGVVDRPIYDAASRVNGFAHVNHSKENPSIGVLLCINGAGIQYKWIREQMALSRFTYQKMNEIAASAPIGSDGLCILPFGNGAERMLNNRVTGGQIINLQFNRHSNAHLYRAALEGIAFSFVHGVQILRAMDISADTIKVGNDNLFRSKIFAETISNLLDAEIQLIETTGAIGAAKAAGVATGIYASIEEAMQSTEVLAHFHPQQNNGEHEKAFESWESALGKTMNWNKIINTRSSTKHLFSR